MHAKKEGSVYTKGVTARVTPEMLNRIREAASEAHLQPSIWMRKVLAKVLEGDADVFTVLEEVLDIRLIMLNVFRDAAMGLTLTPEGLEEIKKRAEARKFSLAQEKIAEWKAGDE